MKDDFLLNGFSINKKFISEDEVSQLSIIYDRILNDKEKTLHLRSDLSGNQNRADEVEKITQIMCPSRVEPILLTSKTYQLVTKWVKARLGNDMELDFDMLISKAPYTNTETPWHQDAAYWIKMPDKRAVSCWIALDDVFEENGCMWFIPKTNDLEILEHKALPNKGALFCEVDTKNAVIVPLTKGGCTFHDGYTLHYSKGNSTETLRRALILNFRPKSMIELERKQGVDHTGTIEIRNKK